MKIALLCPPWRIPNPYPPLGLAYIAACLEADQHEVAVFDLSLARSRRSLEKRLQSVESFGPAVVGFSVMSHTYDQALALAGRLKKSTAAAIVFGGPHPTVMPRDVLRNECVDFVVLGEGEASFRQLCARLGSPRVDLPGIGFKQSGEPVVRERKDFIDALDGLPFPARHLLALSRYGLKDDAGRPMATVLTSRGCPYQCIYCYKGIFGRRYRQRSPQHILDELRICQRQFGYRSFYFIDDLFTFNPQRLRRLCRLMAAEKPPFVWQCLARVDNASADTFMEMKSAGCCKVHFGLESGNQGILDRIRKGTTTGQARQAVKFCRDAGIRTKGYFMLGLPGDTLKSMQQTVDFARELELDEAMFSICTPFPGTHIWTQVRNTIAGDLSSAFYHPPKHAEAHIYHNLADATDDDILDTLRQAERLFDTRRKKWNRRLGKPLGDRVYDFLEQLPIG
jgi:radical SAM superfamily enzyme YgiQ (UPF0313 family)